MDKFIQSSQTYEVEMCKILIRDADRPYPESPRARKVKTSKPVENFYKSLFAPKMTNYAGEQDLGCSPEHGFCSLCGLVVYSPTRCHPFSAHRAQARRPAGVRRCHLLGTGALCEATEGPPKIQCHVLQFFYVFDIRKGTEGRLQKVGERRQGLDDRTLIRLRAPLRVVTS